MPFMIGVVLAVLVGVFARVVGFDRDRAFYPTAMVVIATYYILFACMGASSDVVLAECAAAVLFVVAAAWGFRSSLWIVAAALVGHGIFDFFHGALIANLGMPGWWPAFCGAYDIAAGAFLAILLHGGRIRAAT